MDQSEGWGHSRYVTLAAVIVMHWALVAAFLMYTGTQDHSLAAERPVEVLFFPPADKPKIRPDNFRPKRLVGDNSISIAPPAIDSLLPSPSSDASATDGTGAGVDWRAEARRALQAYEIRSRLPPSRDSLSNSPAEENWWPQARRRAGAPFKTAAGDWIVWINSNCYQVATSESHSYTLGAMLPRTVCAAEGGMPRGDEPPEQKKRRPPTN